MSKYFLKYIVYNPTHVCLLYNPYPFLITGTAVAGVAMKTGYKIEPDSIISMPAAFIRRPRTRNSSFVQYIIYMVVNLHNYTIH